MDFEVYCRIVDEIPTMTELHLQGLGEPTMHPRFFDMVSYAAGKGIQVSTNTNLTLLNRTRALKCISSGLARLHASLDGATAATYEGIRRGAHHARVLKHLQILLDIRREKHSATPFVQIVYVVMRRNLAELPDLLRQAQALGVDEVFVQHLCHDFGEASLPAHYRPMRAFVAAETLLGEDEATVAHVFDAARELARELGITLRLPRIKAHVHPPGTPGRQRCDWPFKGGYISYQGLAMPCCMIATPDRLNFGSVAERGVEAIWNSEAFHAFRAQLDSDTPPEICRSCAVYSGTF